MERPLSASWVGHFLLQNPFRRRRLETFFELFRVNEGCSILDVGGSPMTWDGSGVERSETILNQRVPLDRASYCKWIECDACDMSILPDKSFDIAFSNSVIEHVGGIDRQRQMADEIRRVARKYWVQTPNKHFPLELHFLFPFFQYLPRTGRVRVAKFWPFSYSKFFGLDPVFEAENIWLLDKEQLRSLFPDGELFTDRFFCFTKSLVIARR